MRLYANGKVSNGEESEFILTDLCFATDSWNDPTIPGEDCLILSGQTCEGFVKGNDWSGRAKGVDVFYGDEEYEDYSDFQNNGTKYTPKEILNILLEKNMRLRNCKGYIEFVGEADVKVDYVKLVDNDSEIEIPATLFEEEIEFIS